MGVAWQDRQELQVLGVPLEVKDLRALQVNVGLTGNQEQLVQEDLLENKESKEGQAMLVK